TMTGVVPKIIDFGISKTIGTAITADGQVVGTPSYMSPEQAMGLSGTTPAIDIWAVGIMLYEALVGTLPFTGKNYDLVLRSILRDPPAEIPPWVDVRVGAIILRCLQKDPAARFPGAAALREELERALDRRQRRAWATTHRSCESPVASRPAPAAS